MCRADIAPNSHTPARVHYIVRARSKALRAGHWGLDTPRKAQNHGKRTLKANFFTLKINDLHKTLV